MRTASARGLLHVVPYVLRHAVKQLTCGELRLAVVIGLCHGMVFLWGSGIAQVLINFLQRIQIVVSPELQQPFGSCHCVLSGGILKGSGIMTQKTSATG